jgi:hypothetical protein
VITSFRHFCIHQNVSKMVCTKSTARRRRLHAGRVRSPILIVTPSSRRRFHAARSAERGKSPWLVKSRGREIILL